VSNPSDAPGSCDSAKEKHALPIFALIAVPRPGDREVVFDEVSIKEGR
jgi:hypothetical protein